MRTRPGYDNKSAKAAMLLKARFEQARWLALITYFLFAISCSAQSISGQQIARRNSSERTYKKVPQWEATFEDWCLGKRELSKRKFYRVNGQGKKIWFDEGKEETHMWDTLMVYIFSKWDKKLRKEGRGEDYYNLKLKERCAAAQDFLENDLRIYATRVYLSLNPMLVLKDAKKLHVIKLDGQGVFQEEVDKFDFLNDYNPRFRRLTLPDNETGDYAKCPIINEEKCRK